MKKCRKCGAVRGDGRSTCIDCGSILDSSVGENEKADIEADFDDKLDDMTERTDDFYVSRVERILGIICIVVAVAGLVILNFANVRKAEIEDELNRYAVTLSNGAVFEGVWDLSGGEAYDLYTVRRTVDKVATLGLIGFFLCVCASLSFLAPRFVWNIGSLGYRLRFDSEPTPSYFSIISRKIEMYVFFVSGVMCVIAGYLLYF